jgi:hypothetical protein
MKWKKLVKVLRIRSNGFVPEAVNEQPIPG